jgi:hypothetical protein
MINLAEARELDKAYERYTDKLIEEHFGTEDKAAHVVETLKDVEIALKHLRKCREWLEEALAEDPPPALEYLIGSYYDEVDNRCGQLSTDLEKWGRRSWK